MKELIKKYLMDSLNTKRILRKKIVLMEEQIETMIENAKERELAKEELSKKASMMQKKARELNKELAMMTMENNTNKEIINTLTKKVEKYERREEKRKKDNNAKKR